MFVAGLVGLFRSVLLEFGACLFVVYVCVFFFKQKTAYEIHR